MEWLGNYESLFWWLAVSSVVMFASSLIVIPWLLVRIPSDFFVERSEKSGIWKRHPAFRKLLRVAKNLLGILFILSGIFMLLFPGQGILTILLGVLLLDFPGKKVIKQKIISQPFIIRPLNTLRTRYGKPPFLVPVLNKKRK